MNPVDAIVLVGGKGTRLRPLTLAMPKPVSRSSGATKRPSDCRAPCVISRMAAAPSISGQVPGVALTSVLTQ
jgi:hypothetical protein